MPPTADIETMPTPAKPSAPSLLSASGAQRAVFQVCLEGQAPRPVKLKLSDAVCDSASRLGQALAGIPTDLGGRIVGWYRIRQGTELVSGTLLTEGLDPNQTVEIVRIGADSVHVTFETQGVDVEHRFQSPVSTNVPSAFIVSHLMTWLNLPTGNWKLSIGDVDVLPMQTLSELNVTSGATITVTT
jgi:hypothetical protein